MKFFVSIVFVLSLLACKKSEEAKPQAQAQPPPTAQQPIQPPAPKKAVDQDADHILVHAKNTDPTKPEVDVVFPTWTVTKAAFDPAKNVMNSVRTEMEARGLFTRVVRDIILLAPPLVITEAQVDRVVEILRGSIAAVLPERV